MQVLDHREEGQEHRYKHGMTAACTDAEPLHLERDEQDTGKKHSVADGEASWGPGPPRQTRGTCAL